MNGVFPIIKISNNFDQKETAKVINSVLEEIKKEKNDDFPYSLAYQDQLKINFCIKNSKILNYANILLFLFIIVIS
jgi:hypothetical protein